MFQSYYVESKYRTLETAVQRKFKEYKFNTITANELAINGSSIKSNALKELYRGLPGYNKTGNYDLVYVADQLMSADFFLDCGHWGCIVDVTAVGRFSSDCSPKLKRKTSNLNKRLEVAMQNKLEVNRKPIMGGLILALDYIEAFTEHTLDLIYDALDLSYKHATAQTVVIKS